jgi:putative two-component system response regulator
MNSPASAVVATDVTAAPIGRLLVVDATGDVWPRVRELTAGGRWDVSRVESDNAALRHLRADPTIDLLLLAPGELLGGPKELCRCVKLDARTSRTSVIFLLPPRHADASPEAFEAGADDCVLTSAPWREIQARLDRALRVRRATSCLEDSAQVITALAAAIEGKDQYTCGHVERVGAYAVEIGRRVGVDNATLEALKVGGVVHDIGKVAIPDHILNKPGRLTEAEMAVMRRHPVIGHDILKPLRTFRQVLPIVRWHHERPNGRGYPDGLSGDEIPLPARIASVADCFDALITDRPYRSAFPIATCREVLQRNADNGDLDANLVQTMLEMLDDGLGGASRAA